MGLRKLEIQTLPEVLSSIRVGETVIAPAHRSRNSIKAAMARLMAKTDMVFTSTTRTGELTITRIR
jgi:hypothetical protein